MNEITLNLKMNRDNPLYEQIYEHLKEEIRNGNIPCGTKLPSTRILCEHLDVSRSTVQMAYDQLLSEGYIESRPCKGYYAAEVEGLYRVELEPTGDIVAENVDGDYQYDFSPRGIDLNSFPFNQWRKITKNVLVDDNKELFAHGNAQGELSLRQTISKYLYQSRGVVARPENIVVGAGNEYLLLLLDQILEKMRMSCNRKLSYAMESPTYRQTYRILTGLGEQVVPVSQDSQGMEVASLEKSGANVAYIMPSHQYPLGIVMPMKRRMEILKWAEKDDFRYIIEDDYDSEFRYRGKPIPALCGFDKEQKVIYIGTFSKSIAPAIRMSYLVLPDALTKVYREQLSFYSCTVSRIDQMVVKEFMESGAYEKHLNKMRALYKSRHEVLMESLGDISDKFLVSGENAGIHILLTSKEKWTEQELIAKAKKNGVRVYPLSDNEIMENARERYTVIVGYANMEEEEIREGIRHLKEAWGIE